MSEAAVKTGARAAAVQFLTRILEDGEHSDRFSEDPLFQSMPEDDRRLTHELVLGVLRHLNQVDGRLDSVCRRPVRHLAPVLRNILRTAVYQSLFLDKIPSYAVVNEAVALSRHRGFSRQTGFVNAVLRRLTLAEGAPATADGGGLSSQRGLAQACSHPEFLVSRWLDRHDPDEVKRWMDRSNRPPEHFLTVMAHRQPVEDAVRVLGEAGIPVVRVHPRWPVLAALSNVREIEALIREGAVAAVFQDIWSWAVVACLPERPYLRILDACSAPGGKTLSLRSRFPRSALFAMDKLATRLGVVAVRASAETPPPCLVVGDAAQAPFGDGAFDLVLVDAPCSGTGTLQKNPDIRHRLKPGHIDAAASAQRRILSGAAALVARGGILAYATCSVEPEENEDVARDFLRDNPQFRPSPISPGVFLADAACYGGSAGVAGGGEPTGGGLSPRTWAQLWADPGSLVTPEGFFRSFPRAPAGEGFFCAIFERTGGSE